MTTQASGNLVAEEHQELDTDTDSEKLVEIISKIESAQESLEQVASFVRTNLLTKEKENGL